MDLLSLRYTLACFILNIVVLVVITSRHFCCFCQFPQQAFSYELRYSTNFSEVRYNFDNSHRVTQDQLVYGNLSHISAAGVIETVIINLPERGQDIVYYFAIRAWDEAGNGGDLSNIASLSSRTSIFILIPNII